MIKFQNVTKVYPPDITVLENISFEIKPGEFVSIVGRSGAGKTSLIRLLIGIEEPTSGEVLFNEKNVSKMKVKQLQAMRRKIGVVYQDYKLLANKTVFENIAYILAVKGKEDKEIRKEVKKILEITGLLEKSENFPSELSGGEQQRLAIARATVGNPEVIIADEPTGNLDPYNTYEIVSLLKKLNDMGKTIILASHDKEVINKLDKRVITLDENKIIKDAKTGKFIL